MGTLMTHSVYVSKPKDVEQCTVRHTITLQLNLEKTKIILLGSISESTTMRHHSCLHCHWSQCPGFKRSCAKPCFGNGLFFDNIPSGQFSFHVCKLSSGLHHSGAAETHPRCYQEYYSSPRFNDRRDSSTFKFNDIHEQSH